MGRVVLLGMAAVVGAEAFAAWWMGPRPIDPNLPVLEWSPPGEGRWQAHHEAYDEVDDTLRCSSGWVGNVESGGRPVRISFFRWDQVSTINTLDVFNHMPEICMGSVGMRLQRVHEPRILEIDGRSIKFDVTFFRPENGMGSTYVYKCYFVAGEEEFDLREGYSGVRFQDLRKFRLMLTWRRFRPPYSRVLMGGISGVPTEELAWQEFRSLVEPHIRWVTPDGKRIQ
jgi:hypothetical protein